MNVLLSSDFPPFLCLRYRGIDLAKIAEKLPGASGAEIKAVCTEAGMYALRERRVHVTQEDFEMAVSKVATCPVPSSHSQKTAHFQSKSRV